MEIHAPHGGVENWKDFLVHIAVVTLGILIAFSFEGAREWAHERTLVKETREAFRGELKLQKKMMAEELPAVQKASADLKELGAHFTESSKEVDLLGKRIGQVHNPYYFFHFEAWQTAVASGGLAKMSEQEELQYSAAELAIRLYSRQQDETRKAEESAIAFFQSHPNPSKAEIREGWERLLLYQRGEDVLAHMASEAQRVIDSSYEISER